MIGDGAECLETRWRGQSGEVDLIFRHDGVIVFVEVKAAKSMDRAIEQLAPCADCAALRGGLGIYRPDVPRGAA